MAGAFGALGGDLSSINVNPAGSAIFTNHQAALPSPVSTNTIPGYFGTNSREDDNSFDLNQAGGVYVLQNEDKSSGWKKFTFAIDYENTNNFRQYNWYSAGLNPTSSIADYFLYYANANGGVPLNALDNSYYEELNYRRRASFSGYQGYIINPVNDNPNNSNTFRISLRAAIIIRKIPLLQQVSTANFLLTLPRQYKDRLYVGINLNSHFTDYTQSTIFEENNQIPETVYSVCDSIMIYTLMDLASRFRLAPLRKLRKLSRLGLAYESPTWMRLNDELYTNASEVSG